MPGVIYNVVVPILVFLSILAIGASLLLARVQRKMMISVRLQDSRFVELPEKDKTSFGFVTTLAKIGNFFSHGHTTKTLNEQLLRAGYTGSAAPAIYTGIKVFLFAVGFVIVGIIVLPTQLELSHKIILIAIGASVPFFLPNVIVVSQLRRRREDIRIHLPEAVDLLEICVSSGIGLDMAWHMVSEEIQRVSSILAKSMSLTNFEVNLGAGRAEALRHMAERTGVNELASLAAILIQTERFGTSIAETLQVFANSMREERSHAAQESAEKMAVKLIFPMVLFIFPAVIVTVVGPALIHLLGTNILGSS
ncbi:MAG: type II secretion system F family protein [Planctomycetota bacterium]|jgi:tight adherence protein C